MVEDTSSVSVDVYYNKIINFLFCEAAKKSNANFKALKDMFRLEINSNRRMSYIKDIKGLVEILQKRREIHAFKIELLENIFDFYDLDKTLIYEHKQFLHSLYSRLYRPSRLVKKVNCYALQLQNKIPLGEQLCVNLEYELHPRNQLPTSKNYHYSQNHRSSHGSDFKSKDESIDQPHPTNTSKTQFHEPSSSTAVPNRVIEIVDVKIYMLPERVIEIIVSEIGRKWKELARHLSLVEGRIDKIADQSLNLPEKIRTVLQDYETECVKDEKEDQIHRGLLKALRRIGRMDLHDRVEELLTKISRKNTY